MTKNLIPFKVILGKYFPEVYYSSQQAKYTKSKIERVFEQKFRVQDNKPQLFIDHTVDELSIIIYGNEIHVSKNLYDHENVIITNSTSDNNSTNLLSFYDSDTFSAISYLICNNHSIFNIVGDIEKPIYVKYKSDFESVYCSLSTFNIENNAKVEIIEEIESKCVLNSVTNYTLGDFSTLNLSTFYKNNISSLSYIYRNVIVGDSGNYDHILLGQGASNCVDENKILLKNNSKAELSGIVNSNNLSFHSILNLLSFYGSSIINVDYKHILDNKADVSFTPVSMKDDPRIHIEDISKTSTQAEIKKFISPVLDKLGSRNKGSTKRMNDNRSDFLNFI